MLVLVQSQDEMSSKKEVRPKPKEREEVKRNDEIKEPYLYGFDKKRNPKTAVFLEELRTDATRRNYARDIVRFLKNESDSFLALSKQEKEEAIRSHIRSNRGKISDSYLCSSIVGIKSLLERYEQEVNWNQIKRMLPKVRQVARDRAPTKEEIRKLLKVCDIRLRAAVLVLASSGIRAGGLAGLRVEDYTRFEWKGNKLGRLVIYRGESEEYVALISCEAVKALDDYLEFRKSKGEELSGDTPLFRNKYGEFSESNVYRKSRGWTASESFRKRPVEIADQIPAHGLQQEFYHKWRLAGVRGKEKHRKGKPFEFKAVHGFRKYFKTFAPRGMEPETARDDVELLMGHVVSYHKPSFEHLCDQYTKALPSLSITEASELKIQLDEEKNENKTKIEELEQKLLAWKVDALSFLQANSQFQRSSEASSLPQAQNQNHNVDTESSPKSSQPRPA